MGTAASLLLLAMGALLHFAAPATDPGLDLTLVSTFLLLVGSLGLLLPRVGGRSRRGAHAVGRRARDDRA